MSPLERFQIEMGKIEEALNPKKAGADPEFNLAEAKFARFKSFQELQQASTKPINLPQAALRDTLEAASVAAQSQVEGGAETTEQKMLNVLEKSKIEHERIAKESERTNVFLEKLKREGKLPPVIDPPR